jgi:activator of HSP90 ATPase
VEAPIVSGTSLPPPLIRSSSTKTTNSTGSKSDEKLKRLGNTISNTPPSSSNNSSSAGSNGSGSGAQTLSRSTRAARANTRRTTNLSQDEVREELEDPQPIMLPLGPHHLEDGEPDDEYCYCRKGTWVGDMVGCDNEGVCAGLICLP